MTELPRRRHMHNFHCLLGTILWGWLTTVTQPWYLFGNEARKKNLTKKFCLRTGMKSICFMPTTQCAVNFKGSFLTFSPVPFYGSLYFYLYKHCLRIYSSFKLPSMVLHSIENFSTFVCWGDKLTPKAQAFEDPWSVSTILRFDKICLVKVAWEVLLLKCL